MSVTDPTSPLVFPNLNDGLQVDGDAWTWDDEEQAGEWRTPVASLPAFQARKITSLSTTGDVTGWTTADIVDSAFSWDTSNGILTILTAGRYEFYFRCQALFSGSMQLDVELHSQPAVGGGYALVPGGSVAVYATDSSTNNDGGVGGMVLVDGVGVGDTFKLRWNESHAGGGTPQLDTTQTGYAAILIAKRIA